MAEKQKQPDKETEEKNTKAGKDSPASEVKQQKPKVKQEAKKTEVKKEEPKEVKKEEPKEVKKEEPPKKRTVEPLPRKTEAFARGRALHVSKKQCMYICSFIKNKNVDQAINDLELVKVQRKAVPFKGEIPHRKGKGMMSGRYPVKAAGLFIKLLKGLRGNMLVGNMDLDKSRICIASASWASRPMRTGGRQAKRTNVLLKAMEEAS